MYQIYPHLDQSKLQKRRFLTLHSSLPSISPVFLCIPPLAFWNLIPKKDEIQLLQNQFIDTLIFHQYRRRILGMLLHLEILEFLWDLETREANYMANGLFCLEVLSRLV